MPLAVNRKKNSTSAGPRDNLSRYDLRLNSRRPKSYVVVNVTVSAMVKAFVHLVPWYSG